MPGLLFEQFIQNMGHVKNQPPNSPMRRKAEQITPMFDLMVQALWRDFPCPKVNELMELFFKLVGHKVTPAAIISEKRPSLSFYFEVQGKKEGIDVRAAAVVVPINWLELCSENPRFQCGGMVFTASKAQDYYNDQFDFAFVEQRGKAHEAEFLNAVKVEAPDYQFNNYQKQVLTQFPQGLASLPGEYIYVRKPWNPNTPKSALL